jgi:hypothetical protein
MRKDLSVLIVASQDAQEDIRRKVYPAVPPKDMNIYFRSSSFRVAAFVTHEESDYTLYVISFGYSDYRGRICDTWHTDWYRGPEDPRLWEHAHAGRKDVSAFPGNDMERLAWEGKWRDFVGCTPEKSELALKHRALENRTRQLYWRQGSVVRGIQNIVDASLRKQQVQRYGPDSYYQQDRKVGPRVLLGGTLPCYYEGEGLVFREITDTFEVPLEATLSADDRNFHYGKGSNAELKNKLQTRKREREKKNGR